MGWSLLVFFGAFLTAGMTCCVTGTVVTTTLHGVRNVIAARLRDQLLPTMMAVSSDVRNSVIIFSYIWVWLLYPFLPNIVWIIRFWLVRVIYKGLATVLSLWCSSDMEQFAERSPVTSLCRPLLHWCAGMSSEYLGQGQGHQSWNCISALLGANFWIPWPTNFIFGTSIKVIRSRSRSQEQEGSNMANWIDTFACGLPSTKTLSCCTYRVGQ